MALELICVEGPMAGERIPLSRRESLLIGRARRGLHLVDPLVNVEHAEIVFTTDQWYILDKDSHTGTFVNDRRLDASPVALCGGMQIRIGESLFQVVEIRERPAWVKYGSLFGISLIFVAIFLTIYAARPIVYEPVLHAPREVRMGQRQSKEVQIPDSFIREFGLDHRDLTIERISDFDADGIDELWLRSDVEQWLISFEKKEWKILGRFPLDCQERRGEGFPVLSCGSGDWYFENNLYQPAPLDGVIVWSLKPDGSKNLVASIVTQGGESNLAGFLADRGVVEPIHYLVCEEAVPGLAAQVLTIQGELKPLTTGCLRKPEWLAPQPFQEEDEATPLLFAFTAEGRQALLRDLSVYLAGDSEGAYATEEQKTLLTSMKNTPLPRKPIRLVFPSESHGTNAVANTFHEQPRTLLSTTTKPKQPMLVWYLSGPGETELDPPGCARLKLKSTSWFCTLRRGCFPNQVMLTIDEIGCGAPRRLMEVPFRSGIFEDPINAPELHIAVDTQLSRGQVDVLRIKAAWQPSTD